MDSQLKANLEAKMQEWIEENCEDINTYWPSNAAELMAIAAGSTVDAMVSLSDYLRKEQGCEI